MEVRRTGVVLAVFMALSAMGGCATYGTLGGKDGAKIYGGTRLDATIIAEGLSPAPDSAKSKAVAQPVLVWAACCGLADMPFSLLADTALLPITVPLAVRDRETDAHGAQPAAATDKPIVPRRSSAE